MKNINYFAKMSALAVKAYQKINANLPTEKQSKFGVITSSLKEHLEGEEQTAYSFFGEFHDARHKLNTMDISNLTNEQKEIIRSFEKSTSTMLKNIYID